LVEKAQFIAQYLTRYIFIAIISYVMARTRRDLGSKRFHLVEALKLILLSKLVYSL
jgi:hypothetical protein